MGRNRKMTTDLYELNRIANMEINTLKAELAKVNKGSQRNAHINQSLVKQLEATERTLQAMRNIVHGWENSNYDEQDCLHYLVKALHMEPNNETTED